MKLIKGRTLDELLTEPAGPGPRPRPLRGGLRAGVPGAGLRPRPRRHPPRPQAGQRHGRGLRRGPGHGLGPGQGARRTRPADRGRPGGDDAAAPRSVRCATATGSLHAGRQRAGHAGLHAAGAGGRGGRQDRRAQRRVRPGGDPGGDPDGPAAVRGRPRRRRRGVQAAQGKVDDCFARLDACGAEPELVALCKRCLAPEPADRPADAGEVAAAVAGLRQAAEERARRAELERRRRPDPRRRGTEAPPPRCRPGRVPLRPGGAGAGGLALVGRPAAGGAPSA